MINVVYSKSFAERIFFFILFQVVFPSSMENPQEA